MSVVVDSDGRSLGGPVFAGKPNGSLGVGCHNCLIHICTEAFLRT
jgi:hypothetical protein